MKEEAQQELVALYNNTTFTLYVKEDDARKIERSMVGHKLMDMPERKPKAVLKTPAPQGVQKQGEKRKKEEEGEPQAPEKRRKEPPVAREEKKPDREEEDGEDGVEIFGEEEGGAEGSQAEGSQAEEGEPEEEGSDEEEQFEYGDEEEDEEEEEEEERRAPNGKKAAPKKKNGRSISVYDSERESDDDEDDAMDQDDEDFINDDDSDEEEEDDEEDDDLEFGEGDAVEEDEDEDDEEEAEGDATDPRIGEIDRVYGDDGSGESRVALEVKADEEEDSDPENTIPDDKAFDAMCRAPFTRKSKKRMSAAFKRYFMLVSTFAMRKSSLKELEDKAKAVKKSEREEDLDWNMHRFFLLVEKKAETLVSLFATACKDDRNLTAFVIRIKRSLSMTISPYLQKKDKASDKAEEADDEEGEDAAAAVSCSVTGESVEADKAVKMTLVYDESKFGKSESNAKGETFVCDADLVPLFSAFFFLSHLRNMCVATFSRWFYNNKRSVKNPESMQSVFDYMIGSLGHNQHPIQRTGTRFAESVATVQRYLSRKAGLVEEEPEEDEEEVSTDEEEEEEEGEETDDA